MLDNIPIVTIVSAVIAIIAAVAGAAVVIFGHPGALSFDGYLNDMAKFVGGLGLVGLGRGISIGLKSHHAVTSGHATTKTKTGV